MINNKFHLLDLAYYLPISLPTWGLKGGFLNAEWGKGGVAAVFAGEKERAATT